MPTALHTLPSLEQKAKHGTVLVLALFVSGLCLLLFRRFFVGPYQYIFLDMSSDTLRINLPTLYMLWDMLTSGISGWSLQMGVGTNVLSHADVLFDPFTYLAFLGGRAHIADLLILPVLLKIVCAALTCYGFLRCFSLRRSACAVASVAYAFSGYMLVMGRNYVFSTICVYLPLVLWGLERFLHKKQCGLLLGSLFLIAIYFYYFFYMTAAIVAVYACIRFGSLHGMCAKTLAHMLLRLLCIGVTALLLASFIVVPTVLLTMQSSRLASTGISSGLLAPDFCAFFTALARLFGADAAGVFEVWNYAGYNLNYFELATFTSALCALIFPQFLFACSPKQRRVSLIVVGVVAVALLLPAVSYALNGFSALTYRWSFVVNLLLSLCCALGLHSILERGTVQRRVLLWSIAACCFVLLTAQTALLFWNGALTSTESAGFATRFSQVYFQHPSTLLAYAFLGVYCVVLLLGRVLRFSPVLLCTGLLLVLSGEIFFNYYHWLHSSVAVTRNETRPESSFVDDSYRLIKALQAQDTSFYRIAKNYDSVRDVESGLISDNDAMAQGFYGLQSYNSQNQPSYIDFLQRMGIFVTMPLHTPAPDETPQDMTGTALNFINGVGTRYDIASYLGTKYYLVKEAYQPQHISPDNRFYYFDAAAQPDFIAPDYFSFVREEAGICCYENKAYFPFAFARSNFVRESEFALLSNAQKDAILACYGVLDDALAEQFAPSLVPMQQALVAAQQALLTETAAAYRAQLHALTLRTDGDITVELTVDKDDSIVTFTTPFEDGWHITIDDSPATALRTDNGMLGVATDKGTHTFHLAFFSRGLWLGVFLSVATALGLCAAILWRFWRKKYSRNQG